MTKRQKTIIALLVLATVAAGIGLWTSDAAKSSDPHEHAGHETAKAGHGESDHDHADEHDHRSEEGPGSSKASGAGGGEHAHQEGGEGEHGDHDEHVAGEQDHDADPFATAVRLTPAQMKSAGVELAQAQAGEIRIGASFQGEVRLNADRTAQVVPRVAGVVEAVKADLGQAVRKGQVLAVISSPELSDMRAAMLAARERAAAAEVTFQREKRLWEQKVSAEQDYRQAQQAWREAQIEQRNAEQKLLALGATLAGGGQGAALSRYEVKAPFDGIVLDKKLALGEAVKADSTVFTVSDLSTLWAEFQVPAQDLEKVRVGMPAAVQATASTSQASAKVSHVSSLVGEQTRSATARLVLTNPSMAWRPGLFVTVQVLSQQAAAAVVVRSDAIQTLGDKPAVFVRSDEGFKAVAVKLGRSDGQRTEILGGLAPGQSYVATNSFVLKAELGKGSAEHEH